MAKGSPERTCALPFCACARPALLAAPPLMQLILQVSQQGLRPKVPEGCSPALAELMQRCWHKDPAQR